MDPGMSQMNDLYYTISSSKYHQTSNDFPYFCFCPNQVIFSHKYFNY